MASGCNHLSHVKTQLPYALTVGSLSIVTSLLFINILPWYICFVLGFVILFFIIKYFGVKTA
jgi:hypothetical protein